MIPLRTPRGEAAAVWSSYEQGAVVCHRSNSAPASIRNEHAVLIDPDEVVASACDSYEKVKNTRCDAQPTRSDVIPGRAVTKAEGDLARNSAVETEGVTWSVAKGFSLVDQVLVIGKEIASLSQRLINTDPKSNTDLSGVV